jgi:hypothetical protein
MLPGGALDDLLRGGPLPRLCRLVKVMSSAVTTKVDPMLRRYTANDGQGRQPGADAEDDRARRVHE